MQFLVLQAAAVIGAPRSLGLLPGVFLLLAGEESLEVAGAFFVLRDLRPLARQLHLHRGRDRLAQAHLLWPTPTSNMLLALDINNQRRQPRVPKPHPLKTFELVESPIVNAK